jgi:hypothetical protein
LSLTATCAAADGSVSITAPVVALMTVVVPG